MTKKTNTIQANVKTYYTTIAELRSSCCNNASSCCQSSQDRRFNSSSNEFKEANLGLSCGSPVQYAELTEGLTVLDLGCGTGIDVFRAASLVAPTGIVIGLDMTEAMLEHAQRYKEYYGIKNAIFIKGEIEQLPLPSSSVDRVLSNCVLNLVNDKQRAFSEIFRVLKPGGMFSIADIVTEKPVPPELREDRDLWCQCISGALQKHEYLTIIESTGFTSITIIHENVYQVTGEYSFNPLALTVRGSKPS